MCLDCQVVRDRLCYIVRVWYIQEPIWTFEKQKCIMVGISV